jgi:anti-anti-sigma factor
LDGSERQQWSEPTAHAVAPGDLRLSVQEPLPGVRVLLVGGELDMLTAPALAEEIGSQLAADPQTVIIDLTGVSFLGSSGLFVLVQGQESAARAGVSFSIVANGPTVLRPLEVTGVARFFEIFGTLREALVRG